MDTRNDNSQYKAVIFDFDGTVLRGNLNQFLTETLISKSKEFRSNEIGKLHRKVPNSQNEMREISQQISELNKMTDMEILEKLGFYKDNAFVEEQLWQLVKEQLAKINYTQQNNLHPIVFENNLPSFKILSKDIFEKLNENYIFIGIASFNSYLPIVKKYLKEIVGISDDCLSKIYFEVSFPDKNCESKTEYLGRLKYQFSKAANTNIQSSQIIYIEDDDRHLKDAISKKYPTIKAQQNGQHLYDLTKYIPSLLPTVEMLNAKELISYIPKSFVFNNKDGNESDSIIAAIIEHAKNPTQNNKVLFKLGRIPDYFVEILNDFFKINLVTKSSRFKLPENDKIDYVLVYITGEDLNSILKYAFDLRFAFTLLQRLKLILDTQSRVDIAAMNAISFLSFLGKIGVIKEDERSIFSENITNSVLSSHSVTRQSVHLGRIPKKLIPKMTAEFGIVDFTTEASEYKNDKNPELTYVKLNVRGASLVKILNMEPIKLRVSMYECVNELNTMLSPAVTTMQPETTKSNQPVTVCGFLAPYIQPTVVLEQMQKTGSPNCCIYRIDDDFLPLAQLRLSIDPEKKEVCYKISFLNNNKELEHVVFSSCERQPNNINQLLIQSINSLPQAVINELNSFVNLAKKNCGLVHLHSDKTIHPEEILFEINPSNQPGSALVISTQTPSEEAKTGNFTRAKYGSTGCIIHKILSKASIPNDEKWIIITGYGDTGDNTLSGNYNPRHYSSISNQGDNLICEASEYAKLIQNVISNDIQHINILIYSCKAAQHSSVIQKDSFAFRLAQHLAQSRPQIGFTIVASKSEVERFTGAYHSDEEANECIAFRVDGGPKNIAIITKKSEINAPIEEKYDQFPNGFYITTQGLGKKNIDNNELKKYRKITAN